MFRLTEELLYSLKKAIIPDMELVPAGPNIQYSCGVCTGSCKNSCTGSCKGSCKGGCTRSCKSNSR